MRRILIALAIGLAVLPAFAQRKAAQTPPPTYTLTILVNVKNASILVDGKGIKGNSAALPAGNHAVQVSAPGYKDYATTVDLRSNQTLTVNMQQDLVDLTVLVNVKMAQIWVDGAMIKGNVAKVAPGMHQVKVIARGFAPYETSVQVNQSMTLNVDLQQDLVDLTVLTNVKMAQIWVDGAMIKGNVAKVAPGVHQVKVIALGFVPYEMNVQVNQSMTLNVNLEQDLVDLTILVNVKGAQLWVDNEALKGNVARVKPGSHQIQAQAPGYQVYLQTVVVKESMTLNVNLERSLFSLNVFCDVKGAQIFVNDVEQKSFPAKLPAGKYGIKARARGYADYYEEITLDGDYNMRIQMRQSMGSIVVVIPSDKVKGQPGNRFGTLELFIDNQPIRLNGAQEGVAVAPGRHRVKVVYADLTAELDVQVESDMVYTIEPFLQLKVTAGR